MPASQPESFASEQSTSRPESTAGHQRSSSELDPAKLTKAPSISRRASDAARSMRDKAQGVLRPAQPQRRSNAEIQAPLSSIQVPELLRRGVSMLKASAKRVDHRQVRLLPDAGQVVWETPKKLSMLNIETIRELRWGGEAKADRVQLGIAADAESRWCTIIYANTAKKRVKVLHLIALTEDVFDQWRKALTALYEQRKTLIGGVDQTRARQDVWLRQHWCMADTASDGKLDIGEVATLCRRLGLAASLADVQANFAAADTQKRGYLDFADFQTFVRLLRRRLDIETLFFELSNGASAISFDCFAAFMRDTQQSKLGQEALSNLYTKHCDPDTQSMSLDGFTAFLISSDNSTSAENAEVSMDMTRPLCEYFISSSHNTYLVGGQLSGQSTVEGYVRALQQGCRCVELDVWDGDREPVVYHGRTLTGKITAREALTAIAKYAFVASHFPVILSIEVHCEVNQQLQLSKILRETLGPALVDEPLADHRGDTLPSPKTLKNRILVKFKNHNDREASSSASGSEPHDELSTPEDSSSTSSDSELKRKLTSAMRHFKRDPSSASPPGRALDYSQASARTAPTPRPAMSLELASLLVYTVGVRWRGLAKTQNYALTDVCSLGERTATKAIRTFAKDLIRHNVNHLTRSYPAGTRFTSSNFLPHHMWAAGISMVSMNWQTFDLGLEINSAFFARNGKSGYLLKPEPLRNKALKEMLDRSVRYELDITQLTRSRHRDDSSSTTENGEDVHSGSVSPWVEVAIYAPNSSLTTDATFKRRTPTVADNGFAPQFNTSFTIPFEIPAGMLELAFIRFRVCEGDGDGDKTLGKYCLSLASLLPGYRHLPLYDSLGGMYLFSSLFIKSSLRIIDQSALPRPASSPRS